MGSQVIVKKITQFVVRAWQNKLSYDTKMDIMYVIFPLDDAEFDVTANMCLMGMPMILKHYERKQVCHQRFHRSNIKNLN